jgi:ABC-type multidrug transport system fused ATPase/permease subunit
VSLHLVKHDKIKPSGFIATFMVSFTAMGRLMAGFSSIRNLQHEVGVLTAVETFLAKVRAPKAREAAPKTITPERQPIPGEIRFEGVKFRKGDREILHGVDLDIHAGVTTALVGGWVAARAPL